MCRLPWPRSTPPTSWDVPSDAVRGVAGNRERSGHRPGGSSTETGSVDTSTGTTGVEMAWQEETDVYHRDAFLAGAGTPTL